MAAAEHKPPAPATAMRFRSIGMSTSGAESIVERRSGKGSTASMNGSDASRGCARAIDQSIHLHYFQFHLDQLFVAECASSSQCIQRMSQKERGFPGDGCSDIDVSISRKLEEGGGIGCESAYPMVVNLTAWILSNQCGPSSSCRVRSILANRGVKLRKYQ